MGKEPDDQHQFSGLGATSQGNAQPHQGGERADGMKSAIWWSLRELGRIPKSYRRMSNSSSTSAYDSSDSARMAVLVETGQLGFPKIPCLPKPRVRFATSCQLCRLSGPATQ
uniref:Uncharacterized protein n=1 Tax=Pristionchus pacificus TaxID=54126 RepID=A0A2A6C0M6_PRIPA|eukprot:PDM71724.1 hypothetical protein PRIPAC_38131 [Pristionchus pacificus]